MNTKRLMPIHNVKQYIMGGAKYWHYDKYRCIHPRNQAHKRKFHADGSKACDECVFPSFDFIKQFNDMLSANIYPSTLFAAPE